jgi:hypothetical protein
VVVYRFVSCMFRSMQDEMSSGWWDITCVSGIDTQHVCGNRVEGGAKVGPGRQQPMPAYVMTGQRISALIRERERERLSME